MPKLAIIVGGCIFVAAGLITIFSDFNWQAGLVLLAIGVGFIIFYIKG